MVKDEIQTMVEEFLTESGPSPRFSAAVMAMIPAAGAKLSATAVKTGAAMSGKTIGSKIATAFGASSLSAAGLAAVVGGIWAFLVGAGIAWIQTKKVADRATSDIEKAIHWDDYWKVLFGLAALFLALGLTSMLGLGRAAAYAWWLPVPVLFQWSMIHSLKKQLKLRRIRRVHGRPENEKGMVEPLLSYTPPSSSGATWGIIWGLIGAWGWLIVMLAVGAWFKLVFLFVLLIGTGIFAWLLAVGSKVLNDDMNYAQRQRVSGEFLWKACLVQASFCAAILLLFLDPSVGQYLIKTFQVQVSEKGMTTDLNTPATSMLLLWCVCPFIVTLAGVLRWSSVSRADLADEEHELGWDDGNGKVLYNHPASLGSK